MHVQVNTDGTVPGGQALIEGVTAELMSTLSRFRDRVTRVEVHLSAEPGRSDGAQKRCLIEARPAGRQPVTVTHQAMSAREACSGAAGKLVRLLDSSYARSATRTGRKGGDSIRHLDVDEQHAGDEQQKDSEQHTGGEGPS